MTVLQKAATIAAMTFSLASLLGHSTPVLATGLDRAAITTPALAAINTPTPAMVPQAATVPAAAPAPVAPDAAAAVPIATADRPAFETLAAAVAAQDNAAADETLRCLASAVYFESKGEPLPGQLAVAQVILNRAKSGRFATDVCGVVKQRGQFSFVRGGTIPTIDGTRAAYRTAIAVSKVALAEAWDSPAPKALFFNTPDRAPGGRMVKIAAIGNHVFYR